MNNSAGKRQSGISLIIVMIMLVIIGLTSAATIRNATSSEKLSNNIRMENLAQQYAEAALRYCEAQMRLASGLRDFISMSDGNIVTTAYVAGQTDFQVSPAPWQRTSTWIGAGVLGDASASRTTIPLAQIQSGDSSIVPATLPQCVVERQGLAPVGAAPGVSSNAVIITARGFSPDYTASTVTGQTISGSVVWLQSILLSGP